MIKALIMTLFKEENSESRHDLIQKILAYGDNAIEPLIEILRQFPTADDYFIDTHKAQLHSLAEDLLIALGSPAVPSLIPLLKEDNWGARHGAIWCLRDIADERSILPLVKVLSSDDVDVITETQEALEVFGAKAINSLLEATQSDNELLRENAVFCLGYHQGDRIPQRLITIAKNDSVSLVRQSAINALANFKTATVRAYLIYLTQDADADVAESASDVLGEWENDDNTN